MLLAGPVYSLPRGVSCPVVHGFPLKYQRKVEDSQKYVVISQFCLELGEWYIYTRAPDAGAWGPPVLRGECEEVFVFELSGTHQLHTINTTYQVATT